MGGLTAPVVACGQVWSTARVAASLAQTSPALRAAAHQIAQELADMLAARGICASVRCEPSSALVDVCPELVVRVDGRVCCWWSGQWDASGGPVWTLTHARPRGALLFSVWRIARRYEMLQARAAAATARRRRKPLGRSAGLRQRPPRPGCSPTPPRSESWGGWWSTEQPGRGT
ncbi:hypothetical protein D5H75_40085 [Bailinhaonella thermotolerans]|uniref:Uncharacterized protein n=1 Tax=Bailinhaonella thermotolerans TaxID=1070861 RepID=A0A3A3ZXJ7_9ACTN|nr:hypothetical protein D5H75_40085 [Bailinhaonella thermotolerans]